MVKWVTVEKASELLGLTKQAIYARIKRREWVQRTHWVKKRGRLFLDMPAIYTWIEQA